MIQREVELGSDVAAPQRGGDRCDLALPHQAMRLQHSAGNRAAALLARGQAKLQVGPADDPFEREADHVARQVMDALARARTTPLDDGATDGAVQAAEQFQEPIARRVQRRAAVGAEGGAVDHETESAIRAARSGGQGLDAPLQRQMEGAFGADFGDVRLHSGAGAAALNDSLSAKAFTVGSDIFLGRGAAPLDSADGQELLAHELTHVVQQSGSSGAIRRKVGVEIEIPDMYTAAKRPGAVIDATKTPKIAPREYIADDQEGLLPNDDARKAVLEGEAQTVAKERDAFVTKFQPKKKKRLAGEHDKLQQDIADTRFDQYPLQALKKKDAVLNKRGDPWTLEADQEVTTGKSNAEFVTDAFEDDQAGALGLIGAMAQIAACFFEIKRRGDKGETVVASEDLGKHGTPKAGCVVLPGTGIYGVMQVSVGLRPDMIASLLRQMGGRRTGESDTDFGARKKGQELIGGTQLQSSKVGDASGSIVGMGADFAKRVLTAWHQDPARNADPDPDKQAKVLKSKQLEGLVGLAVMYIVTAATPIKQYVKSIAPLMARNDFAALFGQLPPKEQAYLKGADGSGNPFVELVMAAVAFRGKNLAKGDPLIPSLYNEEMFKAKVKTDVLASLTREKWLQGIAKGVDHLTAAHFEKAMDPAATNENPHLESMGQFGATLNPVGKDRVGGAVFEIRTVGKRYAPLWEQTVYDIFRYIRALNDGIDNPAAVLPISQTQMNDLLSTDGTVQDDAMAQLHKIIETDIKKTMT